MKLVYICGPMYASSLWEREQNIRIAEHTMAGLYKLGAVVHCPHVQGRFLEGVLPTDEFVRRDLVILRRCDALILLSDWDRSRGSLVEKAFAEKIGLPIFLWPDDFSKVQDWLDEPDKVTCMHCNKGLPLPKMGPSRN